MPTVRQHMAKVSQVTLCMEFPRTIGYDRSEIRGHIQRRKKLATNKHRSDFIYEGTFQVHLLASRTHQERPNRMAMMRRSHHQ